MFYHFVLKIKKELMLYVITPILLQYSTTLLGEHQMKIEVMKSNFPSTKQNL